MFDAFIVLAHLFVYFNKSPVDVERIHCEARIIRIG